MTTRNSKKSSASSKTAKMAIEREAKPSVSPKKSEEKTVKTTKSRESKSPARSKTPSKKTPAPSKTPSNKTPSKSQSTKSSESKQTPSRSRSRSRTRKPPAKASPNKSVSKSRSRSRSSSRIQSKKITSTPKNASEVVKKTPNVSSVRPSRTFERADDSIVRSVRNLTQSRERPASSMSERPYKETPKQSPVKSSSCCSSPTGVASQLCRNICSTSDSLRRKAVNTNRSLRRRLGVWYNEIIVLSVLMLIGAILYYQVQRNGSTNMRNYVTSHWNRAIRTVVGCVNTVKKSIIEKSNGGSHQATPIVE